MCERTRGSFRHNGRAADLELDFTPESLKSVETVLGQLHHAQKSATLEQRPSEKQLEGASIMWGVYVGEVVRRHYGGQWEVSKPDGILQLVIGQARLFPLRKVQKRITEGPGDNVAFYFSAMKTVLEKGASARSKEPSRAASRLPTSS